MDAEAQQLSGNRKPQVAMLIATGFGLGYLPKAPGTWGSLGGLALYVIWWWYWEMVRPAGWVLQSHVGSFPIIEDVFQVLAACAAVALAILGLWASTESARFLGIEDPQCVVVDEISGQFITFAVGGLGPYGGPNWKYLVAGFILFRVFDIWKPWPARAAEKLPGGWGIMADDWVAGVYAALALWGARAVGL